ncbi:MAG: hypothetical protein K2M50_07155 [Treponemataceae bacterium]|nr:hypothetical protein [Treponemataceae bacterium]
MFSINEEGRGKIGQRHSAVRGKCASRGIQSVERPAFCSVEEFCSPNGLLLCWGFKALPCDLPIAQKRQSLPQEIALLSIFCKTSNRSHGIMAI